MKAEPHDTILSMLIKQVLFYLLLLTGTAVFGLSAPNAAAESASISGTVKISTQSGTLSGSNVIVFLEPREGQSPSSRPPRRHEINMTDKQFSPSALYIRVGDTVVFPNADPFRHNVFSLSEPNQFDLGTYRTGSSESYTFNEPGLSRIYCNIHRTMAAYVWVGRNDWGAATDENGTFSINDVPPGEYSLTAWNVRGSANQIVSLDAHRNPVLNLTIDAAQFAPKPHRNKFGEEYPAESDEREFY